MTIAECDGDARQLWFKINSHKTTDCFSVPAHRVRSSEALYQQSRQDSRQHSVRWSAGYRRPSIFSAVYSIVVPARHSQRSLQADTESTVQAQSPRSRTDVVGSHPSSPASATRPAVSLIFTNKARMTACLKTPSLNPGDLNSFRPISNLSFLSK